MRDAKPDSGLVVKSAHELGPVAGGSYVRVEDIHAHAERARSAGAEIVRELAGTHDGSREYLARDPEGNLPSFGSYRAGAGRRRR